MFNWLKRKRQQPSQPAQDCYVSYDEMQRQLAEAKEGWVRAERAEKIVRAFAAVLETSSEWILDAGKLPRTPCAFFSIQANYPVFTPEKSI